MPDHMFAHKDTTPDKGKWVVCTICGAYVSDESAHEKWHNLKGDWR